MLIKSPLFVFIIVCCCHNLTVEADESIRKGKFLGLTGYLSGSTDGFRLAPFWKQWNALLQVNVEKNRQKYNGIYVIPASSLYYPPDSYGFYLPAAHNGIGGLNNLGTFGSLNEFDGGLVNPIGYRQPLLFDDKTNPTTLAPNNLADKPKLDIDFDAIIDDNQMLNRLPQSTEQKVSVSNLNMHDDRKSHKRDILHKKHTEDEVVATVMEVTDANSIQTTTNPSTTEPDIDTPITTEFSEPTTTTTPPPTKFPDSTTSTIITTTETPSETATQIAQSISSTSSGFHPILNVYYGGKPNQNADNIFFTTIEPNQDLVTATEKPNLLVDDQNDIGDFKPSIPYTYHNYRYDTDPHFIPIVGTKLIF